MNGFHQMDPCELPRDDGDAVDVDDSGDINGVLVFGEWIDGWAAKGSECFSGIRWEARWTWKSL